MPTIIPAILAKSEADFRGDWRHIKSVARSLHLDVGDGKFVKTRTWADPRVVGRLKIKNLEVHLMVQHPERVVGKWVKAGAKRVIMHVEAMDAHPHLTSPLKGEGSNEFPLPLGERMKVRGRRVEIGLAVNPATSIARLKPFLPFINFVLVMSVVPGAQGRPFDRRAIAKIKTIKRINPKLVVEVDGGLNERTIPKVVAAGAERLVIGSAIVRAPYPAKALHNLSRLV